MKNAALCISTKIKKCSRPGTLPPKVFRTAPQGSPSLWVICQARDSMVREWRGLYIITWQGASALAVCPPTPGPCGGAGWGSALFLALPCVSYRRRSFHLLSLMELGPINRPAALTCLLPLVARAGGSNGKSSPNVSFHRVRTRGSGGGAGAGAPAPGKYSPTPNPRGL